jgi:hypothetical protein
VEVWLAHNFRVCFYIYLTVFLLVIFRLFLVFLCFLYFVFFGFWFYDRSSAVCGCVFFLPYCIVSLCCRGAIIIYLYFISVFLLHGYFSSCTAQYWHFSMWWRMSIHIVVP